MTHKDKLDKNTMNGNRYGTPKKEEIGMTIIDCKLINFEIRKLTPKDRPRDAAKEIAVDTNPTSKDSFK